MGRVILATVVGAVVVFAWGFVAWAGFNLYSFAFKNLPSEAVVVPALKSAIPETGAYWFPGMPEETAATTPEQVQTNMESWKERHKTGPLGLLLYRQTGYDAMSPSVFIRGFVIMLASALMMSLIVGGVQSNAYGKRFGAALLAALFAVLATHASNWNWFGLPDKYLMAMTLDTLVAWTLASLLIAAIVKPARA